MCGEFGCAMISVSFATPYNDSYLYCSLLPNTSNGFGSTGCVPLRSRLPSQVPWQGASRTDNTATRQLVSSVSDVDYCSLLPPGVLFVLSICNARVLSRCACQNMKTSGYVRVLMRENIALVMLKCCSTGVSGGSESGPQCRES